MSEKHAAQAVRVARRLHGPQDNVNLAVNAIIIDLTGKDGLRREWLEMDRETRERTEQTWQFILLQVLDARE